MRIYDPTCGSGGMLIQSKKYLIENNDDQETFLYMDKKITWELGQFVKLICFYIYSMLILKNTIKNLNIQ